ncbi:MAG: FIST signal transduction protein [Leptolyngbyaceae cyanobacterium]
MYLESPKIEDLLTAIADLALTTEDVVLILIGEHADLEIDTLIQQLSKQEYTFIGAIFPAVIFENTHSTSGVILKSFPAATQPYLIQNLDTDISLPEFEEEFDLSEENDLTALVLIDGLTSQISNFLSELYNNLGNSVRYLGGGAGSLSLEQKPCIFTAAGCFQDAAIIFFTALQSQLGVKHGWQRLEGPLPATQTHRNAIAEMNWKNAFQVYKETVEADCHQQITSDNFFEIAKGYPFGIYKEGQEDIVRDPIIVTESGELICVGEVPENALLYILRGDVESLVDSAKTAAAEAIENSQADLKDILVVDCISRVLFLDQDFDKELQALSEKLQASDCALSVEGILTLGEISSYGDGFLEFFNKTIVVGALF